MEELLTREFAYDVATFERARSMLCALAGLRLGENKGELVYNRLARRMRRLRIPDFGSYFRLVESNAEERREFVNALTTNITAFFREPHHVDTIAARARAWTKPRPMRVWSAACSTGEEPYSIAMALCDVARTRRFSFEIVGTDLDSDVLAKAARGVYEIEKASKIPASLRGEYVERGVGSRNGFCRVRPDVAERVRFFQMNLLERKWPSFGTFDAIFVRNVLIYFGRDEQRRVIAHMHGLLEPDGMLCTGHAESLFYASDLFRVQGRTTYGRVS